MKNSYPVVLMREWDENKVAYKLHEDRDLLILLMSAIPLPSSRQQWYTAKYWMDGWMAKWMER